MKKNKFLVGFICINTLMITLFSGCYSSNVIQTGKVMEKGEYEITAGTGFVRLFEATGRIGIGGRTDIGLALAPDVTGHYKLDLKHQVLQTKFNKGFLSLAIGAEIFEPDNFASTRPLNGGSFSLYYSMNHGNDWIYYLGQGGHSKVTDFQAFSLADELKFSDSRRSYRYSFVYRGGFGIRHLIGVDNYIYFEGSYKYRIDVRAYTSSEMESDGYPIISEYNRNFTPSFAIGYVFTNATKRKKENEVEGL